MPRQKITGVIAASVTPFSADGHVDESALGRLMAHYQTSGLSGVFVNSSSGEYFSMTCRQHDQVLAAAVQARESLDCRQEPFHLLSNISSDSLQEAIDKGRQAARLGADVAVAMPPRFFAVSTDELVRFFTSLADALPIPLIVYNHLVRLNNKLSIEGVFRLSEHPRIAGIKDTHNDPVRLMTLLERLRDHPGFSVFAGGDALAGFSALMGGYQMNALCALEPALFLQLQAAGEREDVRAVMRRQQAVQVLMGLQALVKRPEPSLSHFTQSLKAALHHRGLCQTHLAQLGFDWTQDELDRVGSFLDTFESTHDF